MVPEPSRAFASDITAQLLFERHARRQGMTIAREHPNPSVLRYRFAVDVPAHDNERLVTLEFAAGRWTDDPRVRIDGPRCLRHRYADDSICMWLASDSADRRWVQHDGLLALVGQIELHAFCEAECRAGRPWPKKEAPGLHPRKPSCPSCRSRCSS